MFISIIYFYRGGVILLVFSVNNNGLELIRAYNHHVFLNHCTAFSDSEVKLLINSSRDFSVHEIVLSSAKFCNSAFAIQSKKSLVKMLKRMEPKIDPCGTPDNKTLKTLYVCFIFTFYFLPLK